MVDGATKPAEVKISNEEYKGPSKFGSAVTGFLAWAIPGLMASGFSVAARGRGLGIIGGAVTWAIALTGGVHGWNKAAKGKEQFNDTKTQRDNLQIKAAMLETQVEQMHAERKQFSAGMSPRAGNHADGVLADKAAAAGAEAAR